MSEAYPVVLLYSVVIESKQHFPVKTKAKPLSQDVAGYESWCKDSTSYQNLIMIKFIINLFRFKET